MFWKRNGLAPAPIARTARSAVQKVPASQEELLPWGGLWLPRRHVSPNVLALGTPGSGKSLLLFRLLLSLLVRRGTSFPKARALIIDPSMSLKRRLLAYVDGLKVLNPLCKCGVGWALSKDAWERTSCERVAGILTKDQGGVVTDKSSDDFFRRAAKSILTEMMLALPQVDPNWDLYSLVKCAFDSDFTKRVCNLTEDGRACYRQYFGKSEKQNAGITATLRGEMEKYYVPASYMTHATEKYSITEWLHSGHTPLLVASDPKNQEAMAGISRAIFELAQVEVLSQLGDKVTIPTIFWLDELAHIGDLDARPLIELGRKKGVACLLAAQTIDSVITSMGEHKTRAIFGNCPTTALLRNSCPYTTEWYTKFLGLERVNKVSFTYGENPTMGVSPADECPVLPNYFRDLPVTSPEDGINGIFTAPGLPYWEGGVPWAFIEDALDEAACPEVDPRPTEQQVGIPWKLPPVDGVGTGFRIPA